MPAKSSTLPASRSGGPFLPALRSDSPAAHYAGCWSMPSSQSWSAGSNDRNCLPLRAALCSWFHSEAKQIMVAQAADRRAWSAATVDEAKRWYFPLSPKLLAELRGVIASQPADKPITEIFLTENQRSQWSEAMAPALRDLEDGRGFVIIDCLPLSELSQREAVALYWLVGQLLGEPFAQ